MIWTTLFFHNRKLKWLKYVEAAKASQPSLMFYGLRQSYNWGLFEANCNALFGDLLHNK